jgi:photosystem II stability/assembly factor-like uncharacterized protein
MRSLISLSPLYILALLSVEAVLPQPVRAQVPYDTTLYGALEWRMIGPYRGGRSTAAAGVPGQPYVYYLGGTGGGVWKTVDGGMGWEPMTDDTDMAGSIGAIAVAVSDPNVVYVGTGEACPRGNVSPGNGMWKSTDAGKTWSRSGLPEAGQIGAVVVHPRDENLVYVAALGHIFGPNEQRGVYRSKDGGQTWERILYRDDNAGAVDLIMDPSNPRVLYAALWQVRRMPYALESGGAGSGLFKSTDGGDSWTEITRNEGLPESTIGKIGIAVSPVNPERVWAVVEAEQGGVFRSDDAGETWTKVNSDRSLRQRAWYYTHVYADPRDEETVYVLNVRFHKSVDGGKTYTTIRVPHGDNHDLWIDPNDGRRMVNANDGGGNVSYNGGKTWTRQDNQPTAQMYHVTTTADFPYRVCGAQQDNSTMCIASRTTGGGITTQDWYRVAGGESGYIAVRPDNTDITYGGSYGGYLTRHDRSTGQNRIIAVWPDNPMGWGADSLRYRFQWTFPIILSPHDPDVLYVTSQHVHRTTNDGQSWETISPDLTRNDKSMQGPSGGPITKDNTSVEYYGTVFALAPSPLDPSVIWAGSDDGLVHVTRDGGQTWDDITPRSRDLPEWALISIIEASPHEPGTAYVAATRYKLDDFRPYIFKTTDYGRSWRRIVDGIPANHFIRVVREDVTRPGLLYAAGEFGVYVSFDAGAHWQSLQLNLPVVPIHDMVVHGTDLVLATHGRSFWILDDLTPLHQLGAEVAQADRHLFDPRDPVRFRSFGGFGGGGVPGVGSNPASGTWVFFYVKEKPEGAVTLEFLESDGDVIKTFSTEAKERGDRLEVEAGMNRFVWNGRYPDAKRFEGMIMWAGSVAGPVAVPGTYQVRLTAGDWSQTREFELLPDPRLGVGQDDLEAQFALLMRIRDRVTDANEAVIRIRDVKQQLEGVMGRVEGHADADTINAQCKNLIARLGEIEAEIYQTKNRSRQDPLNFPIRLNNKIAGLTGAVASADAKPTDQSRAVFEELSALLQVQLDHLTDIVKSEIPAFNAFMAERDVPAVILREGSAPAAGL